MKRLQMLLAILGIMALIAGVLIIVSTVTVAAPADSIATVTPENIVYVGTNTCLTCHSDSHNDGWHALHSQVIQNSVVTPQAVLADFSAAQAVRQINTGSETHAYTARDVTYTVSSDSGSHYIMKTDDGNAVLPSYWVVTTGDVGEADSTDWVQNCSGCHDSAGKHIEMAQELDAEASADEVGAVRESIVTTTNPEACGRCHDNVTRSELKELQMNGTLSQTMLKSILFTDILGSTGIQQRILILETAMRGKPTIRPIYRRENPK